MFALSSSEFCFACARACQPKSTVSASAHGVVLEAGPERTSQDLYSSQLWARRLKWSGSDTETLGSDPISFNFDPAGARAERLCIIMPCGCDGIRMTSTCSVALESDLTGRSPMMSSAHTTTRSNARSESPGDAEAEASRPAGDPSQVLLHRDKAGPLMLPDDAQRLLGADTNGRTRAGKATAWRTIAWLEVGVLLWQRRQT
jgi:hypothetical protein